jgi:hypothetical protein
MLERIADIGPITQATATPVAGPVDNIKRLMPTY